VCSHVNEYTEQENSSFANLTKWRHFTTQKDDKRPQPLTASYFVYEFQSRDYCPQ